MKHAVRWISTLLLLLMFIPGIVHADPIPPKEGLVQDLAGMMSKEDWPRVKAAANGSLYTFYVLSINSLDGESPSDYATEVYNSWELGTDDIILLLSKQDRHVEMNFNNRTLQDKIDALPEDYNEDGDIQPKLSEYVDRLFIPSAKEGRFADAAVSIMEATNQLKNPDALVQPLPSTEGSSSVSGGDAQDGSSTSQPSGGNENGHVTGDQRPAVKAPISSSMIALLSAAIVTLLLMVCIAVVLWRNNRKRAIWTQVPNLMASASQSLERVRPYTSLYQGETLRTAEQIEQELNTLLVTLQAILDTLRSSTWIQVLKPLVWSELQRLLTKLTQLDQSSMTLSTRISEIEEVEKQVSSELISKQAQLEQVDTLLQQEQISRNWSLSQLTERIHFLRAQFKAIDEMDAFDPLQASGRFTEAKASLDRLESDIAAVATYAEAYRQLPQHSNDARTRFENIIQKHSLKLVRIDPYAKLAEARVTSELLLELLQVGNIPDVERHAELMRQQITDAEQMVQRLANLQLKNAADMEQIVQQLIGYMDEDQHLRGLAAHTQLLYRTKHWQAAWEAYLGTLHVIPDTELRLTQVRTWCQLDTQEYEEARKLLDQIFADLKSRDQLAAAFIALVRKLDQQLDEAKRYCKDGIDAAVKGASLIQHHRLVQQWIQTEQELRKLDVDTQQMFVEPPYDVELLIELCERYAHEAEGYMKDVERTVVLKQNAERRIAEMGSSYQSAYSRTRGKINASRYSHEYDSAQHRAHQLLASG